MKVTLRLRDLSTGDGSLRELESVEEAMAWLRARPAMTEVLGVVFEGLTKEQNDLMRGAMRPLDEAEVAARAKVEEAEQRDRDAKAEARRKEAEEADRREREAAKTADPNRPMELRYRFDRDAIENTNERDDRAIPEVAAREVVAWVAERNEWIAGRGQVVGEAKVVVWPATVPKGQDRVVSGSFVPVTAPKKE